MRRINAILTLLVFCMMVHASQADSKDAADAALAKINIEIAEEQQSGNLEKESQSRWKKIVTLKNFSQTGELYNEAGVQMEWFGQNGQWDNYYRTWQLKANALCALGKVQQSLQETQRMLYDAKQRGNKLGRAMAYKQIGIVYLNMKQTEPAVESLKRYAELIMDEEGGEDFASLSNIYYRMAKAYDYDKAYGKELQITAEWLKFLHEKVGKVERADVRECYHSCYLARAAAFIGMKKMDDARMALDTASHHAHIINTVLGLHHYYKMQARYFLAKGDAAKALLYTDSVTMTTSEKDTHLSEIRAQALMMLGRGADAARIYEQLYHEKDSVFSRDARQHLDELNTLFQLDELKTEQQHTKFKYIIITVSSVMLALLVLLLYGWYTAIRQKKVNRQLRIANKKAKTSARMKSEFIRNVSHEIRTPLNILSGFTQILTKPGLDLPEAEMADVQARIEENAERITKLVDQVLELSDISSEVVIERNDHINAQEILKQAIDSSKIALHTRPENANSAVEFKMAGEQTADSVELITNKVYAIRALSQILENASKFTSEGCIILQMEYTESKVRFVVEDTGVGISAEEAEHIFDEFVQLDEFSDGIGIGLTVARSIAQRMGGNLWLDTDYSHGARFILELLRI